MSFGVRSFPISTCDAIGSGFKQKLCCNKGASTMQSSTMISKQDKRYKIHYCYMPL